LGRLKIGLGSGVVFNKILLHVRQFVKISKLTLLIVHNNSLILLDALNYLINFTVQIGLHAVHIIAFGLSGDKLTKFIFLRFDIDGFSTFASATGRVGTKAKEITKNVTITFLELSPSSRFFS
jgi:hypothetical protein